MSSISQTPETKQGLPVGRLLLGLSPIIVIVGLALAPFGAELRSAVSDAHPHGTDLDLFARIPVVIKVHLLAALAALALGSVLMLQRKGRLFHRIAGWTWVCLVSVVAGSSIFITSLNNGRWSLLHLFTGWTLIILPLAVIWAKRHDVARHRRAMMGLFIGGFAINLLVAFIPGRTLWNLFLG